MRRLDDANAGGALLFDDLIVEGLHPGPVHFRPEMMLGVEAVEEPDPIVELVVTAYAPRYRLVGVPAVMAVVTVQVGKAMAEVPEADEKNDVVPVEYPEGHERADEENQLGHAPERFLFVFAH